MGPNEDEDVHRKCLFLQTLIEAFWRPLHLEAETSPQRCLRFIKCLLCLRFTQNVTQYFTILQHAMNTYKTRITSNAMELCNAEIIVCYFGFSL